MLHLCEFVIRLLRVYPPSELARTSEQASSGMTPTADC